MMSKRSVSRPQPTRPRVCVLALPESSASVIYGFVEVLSGFGEAWSQLTGDPGDPPGFDVDVVAPTASPFACQARAPVMPDRALADVEVCDVAIVTDLAVDPADDHRGQWRDVGEWLVRLYTAGATVCSVCSGSVLLAATGLLDGREATTHWGYVEHFRRFFPAVALRPGRILVADGPGQRIVTAGGMSAWEDLALYLVARYFGEAAAVHAAKVYLFGDRSEGQLLYAARIPPKRHDDGVIRTVQAWAAEHYADPDCGVAMLRHSGLPERTFTRRFRNATGYSPAAYLQALRLEEAKQILEASDDPIDDIPDRIGYSDPASFRRLFKRATGVTPGRYRQRYRTMAASRRA